MKYSTPDISLVVSFRILAGNSLGPGVLIWLMFFSSVSIPGCVKHVHLAVGRRFFVSLAVSESIGILLSFTKDQNF